MNKLFYTFLFLLTCATSFASNDIKKQNLDFENPKSEKAKSEVTSSEKQKDEAIRCKETVSYGQYTVTVSCWFCNCDTLRASAIVALEDMSN